MEAKVLSLSEKRLKLLLRRAALQHIRRELGATAQTLREALFLAEEPTAAIFLEEWLSAVEAERSGLAVPVAPAAWIHLAQELASLLEAEGDWIGYLGKRWRLGAARLGGARRAFYGTLCALALGLGTLVTVLLVRHALAGDWDGFPYDSSSGFRGRFFSFALCFGRVAGTAMMFEHGYYWGKRALSGRDLEALPEFLGEAGGLALVITRASSFVDP